MKKLMLLLILWSSVAYPMSEEKIQAIIKDYHVQTKKYAKDDSGHELIRQYAEGIAGIFRDMESSRFNLFSVLLMVDYLDKPDERENLFALISETSKAIQEDITFYENYRFWRSYVLGARDGFYILMAIEAARYSLDRRHAFVAAFNSAKGLGSKLCTRLGIMRGATAAAKGVVAAGEEAAAKEGTQVITKVVADTAGGLRPGVIAGPVVSGSVVGSAAKPPFVSGMMASGKKAFVSSIVHMGRVMGKEQTKAMGNKAWEAFKSFGQFLWDLQLKTRNAKWFQTIVGKEGFPRMMRMMTLFGFMQASHDVDRFYFTPHRVDPLAMLKHVQILAAIQLSIQVWDLKELAENGMAYLATEEGLNEVREGLKEDPLLLGKIAKSVAELGEHIASLGKQIQHLKDSNPQLAILNRLIDDEYTEETKMTPFDYFAKNLEEEFPNIKVIMKNSIAIKKVKDEVTKKDVVAVHLEPMIMQLNSVQRDLEKMNANVSQLTIEGTDYK